MTRVLRGTTGPDLTGVLAREGSVGVDGLETGAGVGADGATLAASIRFSIPPCSALRFLIGS